jgi:hypothetical protein
VRVLVTEDAANRVWVHYTGFRWIAARYRIRDREGRFKFKMASGVFSSMTASVARR